MIVDTDGETCATAVFGIGSAAASVNWDIMVWPEGLINTNFTYYSIICSIHEKSITTLVFPFLILGHAVCMW